MFDGHDQRDHRDQVHITRDPNLGPLPNASIMGFEIALGMEGATVFMPFSSIASQMPADDARLLKADATAFLRRYGNLMIETARQRFREGELGSPDDLERFEATERMRLDMAELDPDKAAVLAALRAGSPATSQTQ